MSNQPIQIQTKKCPFCAEEDLRMEAIVCKHCGRDLINLSYQVPNSIAQIRKSKNKKWIFIGIGIIALLLIPVCIFGGSLVKKSYTPTPISIEEARKKTLAAMVAALSPTQNIPGQVFEQTPTIEIMPDTGEVGKTRENPIPMGVEKNFGIMSFLITDSVRPADDIVASGNQFNTKPEDTQEYLMVEAKSTCLKKTSEKCSFSPLEFKAVGYDGNVINVQFVVSGVSGQFDSGETFGGSIKAGRLFFLVPKGDPGVVIFYEPIFFGTPTFFSIK